MRLLRLEHGNPPSFAATTVPLGSALAERNIKLAVRRHIGRAHRADCRRRTGSEWSSHRRHHRVTVRSRDRPRRAGPSRLDVVRTMHERKNRVDELSDAFVMLSGFGTFEEFMEAVTWRQLAIHEKPSGVLNVDGYFADLLAYMAHAVEMGFSGRTTQPKSLSRMPGTLLDTLVADPHLG